MNVNVNVHSDNSEISEISENNEENTNAMNDLKNFLKKKKIEEPIEGIVFGRWCWDEDEKEYFSENSPYFTQKSRIIPNSMKYKCLTVHEAQPLMNGWTFYSGYGFPQTYATYIWTTNHIIWVSEYDGSTKLDYAPRNPTNIVPFIPGDGDSDSDRDSDSDSEKES